MLKNKYILNIDNFSFKCLISLLFVLLFTLNSNAQAVNIAATALTTSGNTYPEDGMCPDTNRIIEVKIVNNGTSSLNVSSTPVTITVSISGPVVKSFTTIFNSGSPISPGGSRYVSVSSKGDFSKKGKYTVQMSATCTGDASVGVDQTETFLVKGAEISLFSALPTSSQIVCLNSPITDIVYEVGANAISATVNNDSLPTGVTWSFNYPKLTIKGTPRSNTKSTFNYYVTAKSSCVPSQDSILKGTITVKSLPIIKIDDKSINKLTCFNNTINLNASGGNSYSWSNGVNTSNISINSPDKYIVSGFLNGCSNKDSITITEDKVPPLEPVGKDTSICESGILTLKVTTTAGTTVTWYASDQITPREFGLTYTTPSISSSTTYYVEAKNTATGCVSTKKPINIIVNTPPSKPIASDSSRCGPGSLTLKATTDVGNTINWYASDQTKLPSTGETYTTPPLTNTTTYYVESKNTLTGCTSTLKTSISAIINTFPNEPTVIDKSSCGAGTVELKVSLNGVDQVARWYTNPTGGTSIFTGDTYTTGIISKDSTFYVESVNSLTKCTSVKRVPLKVTINSILSPPTAADVSRCGPGTVTLQATTSTGKVIDWYAQSSGGTILSTGDTYTTSSISSSISYFAEARDPLTGCLSSSRKELKVNIIPFNTSTSLNPDQTLCFNTPLTNITHTTTGATGIGIASFLPTGVTAQWSNDRITISGTPTQSGIFDYIIPLTGGCGTINATGKITVNATNTVSTASTSPTLCIKTLLTDITHTTTGATGIGAAINLPIGVTARWSRNTIIISGTPTQSGIFNYEIPLSGGCGIIKATGKIIVNAENTVSTPSSSPSICENTPLIDITHSTTGASGIGIVSNLPTGLTVLWSGNTITISGTPTQLGTFNYVIPLTGGCGTVAAIGKIIVNPTNTVSTASSSPTLCINTPLTNITHTTTGATGIGVATNLPTGLTALWSGNMITISGTPSQSGTFDYEIPLIGGCGNIKAIGKIIVNPGNTVTVASSSPTLCINTPLTDIIHTTTGATGIGSVSNLPIGLTAQRSGNTITISGTPTQLGTFDYVITLTGGCGTVSATGKIIVNPSNTVGSASATPTLCINTPLTNITHTTTGATGIGPATKLPLGVTADWSGNKITISGTPTQSGTFDYIIPLTGGCSGVNATGKIIVNPENTVSAASSSPTLCVNTNLTSITHTTTGATGIGSVSNLPSGVSASWSGNMITISGKPTQSGTFNYSIQLIGGCGSVSATGKIIVNSIPVISKLEGKTKICLGDSTILSSNTIGGVWSSVSTNVATINTFTGKVLSVAAGSTKIIYSLTIEGCSNSVDTTVTINAMPVVADILGNSTLCVGDKTTLTNITSGGIWTSTSPTVASISSNGELLGLSEGITKINYSVTTLGCTTTKTFDVAVSSYPIVADIVGSSDICEGSTATLSNTTKPGVWSSQNTNIVSVNAFGLITGLGAGSTIIDYTVKNANCITKKSITITVKSALSVSPIIGTTDICIGATSKLTDQTPGGTWSSSDPTVATIDGTGLVKSVKVGSTIIRYDVLTNGVCPEFAQVVFTVNQIPTVNAISDITVCEGSNVSKVTFTGTGSPVYHWTNNNPSIGLVSIGTGEIQSFKAKGPSIGSSSEIAVINITPIANGCSGSSKQFLITVNARDNAGFKYSSNSFCQLDANPSPIITGLTGGTFITSSVNLNVNSSSGIVDLASSTPGYYKITYRTNGTCPNDSIIDFAISDLPTVNPLADQQVCDGTNFNPINFSGAPGTIYNWINDNSNIGLALSGTGNISAFTAKGTSIGASSIQSKIIVTPTSGSCVGIKDTFLLTVNPKDNPSFTYPSTSFCSSGIDPNPTANITGKSGGVFTMSPSGAIFNANNGTITLSTSNAGAYALTYTTNGSCANSQTINITIGSNPSVNSVTSQSICSGSAFDPINFTGTPGTTFNWTSSNSALIGLANSGVGSISSFIGSGASLTSPLITSAITVTPKIGSCTGSSKTFNLSIRYKDDVAISYAEKSYCTSNSNPLPSLTGTLGGEFTALPVGLIINNTTGQINIGSSAEGVYVVKYITTGLCGDTASVPIAINNSPSVNNIPDQTVCSGNSFASVNFTGTPGTIYNWTNSNSDIGLALSGTDTILSFIGKNPGNTKLTSTITVTPKSGACFGAVKTFQLSVNPSENASFNYDYSSVCQNNPSLKPTLQGAKNGVFSSSAGLNLNPNSGEINVGASLPGTYNIVYKTTGTCFGIESNLLTINPIPNVNNLSNSQKCQGELFDPISFSGTIGSTYTWINSNTNIGLVSSGSGNISSFKASGTTIGSNPVSAVLTVTPSINGCSGPSKSMILTTNSLDNPGFSYLSNSFCLTEPNPTPTLSGNVGGIYSVNPTSGLTIDPSTGTLDLSTAIPGNYMVTYSTNGFCKNDSTISISVGTGPSVQSVQNQVSCQNTPFNAINFQGAPGTVYEWTNSNTLIGLQASGVGNINSFVANGTSVNGSNISSTITVTPKIGACIGIPITFNYTVKPLDNANFSYANSSYCKNQINPTPVISGVQSGTFSSSPIGLSMNSIGTINLATSTSGNYTITYTTHGQCPNVSSIPMSIGSSASVNPISDTTVCLGNNFSKIIFKGNPGTIFNWTNNNPSIGIAASGVGDISSFQSKNVGNAIFVVTPVIGSCVGNPQSFTLNVNSVQNSSILYGQTSYCKSVDSDPTPIQTGPNNGVFSSSPAGLDLNSTSGKINLSNSNAGDYVITYSLTSQCSTSSNTTVSIGAGPRVNTIKVDPICNGATFNDIDFSGSPGTQFTWVNSNTKIGLGASGVGNIPGFVGINNTNSSITSNITVTPKIGTCSGTPMSFDLVIRPSDNPDFEYTSTNICYNASDLTPDLKGTKGGVFSSNPLGLNLNASSGKVNVSVSTPGSYNVTYLTNGICPKAKTIAITLNPLPYVNNISVNPKCQGSTFTSISFNGSQNTTFSWKNSNTSIGLGASGIGIIPSFIASGTLKNGASISGIVVVTPEINGCFGSTMSFPLTVNSLDDASFKYAKSSICQTDINLTPIYNGTTGGIFSSSPSGLSINDITGRITIATSTIGSYNITYTTKGLCPDDTTISVVINPLPLVNNITNQSRCFGDSFNPIIFSGSSNTTFNWVNSNSNIGLTNSGVGNINAFIAKGTVFGGNSIVGNVSVTPEINGCFGLPKSFDLTVNPIDNPAFHYDDDSYCIIIGQANPTPKIDGTLGGTFTSFPTGLNINSLSGLIDLNLSNPGTYKIKYTTPGNCKDDSTVTIGVGNNPYVDDVDDQSYCQGDMFDKVLFTGGLGTIFEWTNNNSTVGLSSSGKGDISGFKASGTIDGGSDLFATISVLPRIGKCQGKIVNFKYKVRANPKIIASIANTSKQDTSFCKGGNAILSAVGASKNDNYVWTPHTSLVGNLGIGSIVTTKTDSTQQYIVRGQSQFGCYNYDTLVVKVYNPNVEQKQDTILCAESKVNSIPFVSKLPGTIFEWSNSNPNIGLSFNGNGNINSFTAKNNTNLSKQTSVISVTPKYFISSINKICTGTVMKFNISVNKLDDPTFSGYLAQYCANETANTIPVISGVKGGIFSALPTGLALNSNSGEIFPISSKPGSYSVKYTTNGACSKSDSIFLFINPLVNASISGADTVCLNAVSPQIKFKGENGVAPYIFKYKINGGAIQTVSTGPGKEEISVSVPTNKTGVYSYQLISVEESSSSRCLNNNVFGIQNVIINDLPKAQITSTNSIVCVGGVSPEIRITGINGVSPFTFTYFVSKDGNPFGPSQTISTTQGQFLAKIPVSTNDPGIYNYTVNVVKNGDNLSCSNNINISQTVTIKPLPLGTLTASPVGVCMNGDANIEFKASNGTPPFTFVYSINNTGSQTIKTLNNVYSVLLKANTSTSGILNYKLISISDGDVTSCQNNSVNNSVDLNVTPGTKVNKVQDINVCVNEKSDTIEFTGGISGTKYDWVSNNTTIGIAGLGSGNLMPFVAKNNSGSTTNIAKITVTPSIGQCIGEVMNFDIVVRPKPKAKINSSNTVCPGDSVKLEGLGSELKYVWTPNVSCITCNPVFAKPTENTTYKAFVTDKYNCFDSTEFDVVVYKKPEIKIDEPVVCGEPELVTLKGKGNNTYTYNEGIVDGVPFMPKKGKSFYLVTVKDNLGCKATDTVNVYVVDKPASKFSASTETGLASDLKPLNILLTNKSLNSSEFEWYFRNGDESPIIKNTLEPVTALYKKPGIYVITLISKNGKCIDSSSISIKIDKLDTPRVEIAPNVFTPDNDGTNDFFFLSVKNAKNIYVTIFNRWGNPVYEMTETSQTWDGSINGKDADEGVYYYQYEIEGSSGEKVKGQGYVQLIRN